jgi:serine/threonine protein kinase
MALGTTGTLLAGRYRTIERVGSGGMATVLLAEDERLGRQVAVKRLHAESPEDTARRFKREARLGASLNHPNLVAVYDIVTDDEGVLIVMEYVEGETLRDAIDRGPLEPGRAIEVLRGLAAAIDHAHEEGIVHRDVKPANVLLGRDGRTKLADLGIATAVEGTRITMSGTVLGTAAYMAPEQLEGHEPGPAADVYSLAVVAWETLSGKRAYEGRSPLEIAHRKAAEPPPDLREARPEISPAAAALLSRAMGPDPQARPVTAGELVRELDEAVSERPTTPLATNGNGRPAAPPVTAARVPPAQPPSPAYARHDASRGRPSWLAPLAALLAVIALGAGGVFLLGGDSGSSDSGGKSEAAAGKKKKSKVEAKKSEREGRQASPAPTAEEPAPAAEEPAPPAEEPSASSSGYELPQPSGDSASEGARLNAQGKRLIDGGDYEGAVPVLEQAVRSFPAGTTAEGSLDYAFTLFNLGHALRMAGRPADAVPVLEERLKNPNQRSTVQQELDAAKAAAESSG